MQIQRHGSSYLRYRAENAEARAAARAAHLEGGRAMPFVIACAWHENVQGPNVTHTICPRCLSRLFAGLDARGPSRF